MCVSVSDDCGLYRWGCLCAYACVCGYICVCVCVSAVGVHVPVFVSICISVYVCGSIELQILRNNSSFYINDCGEDSLMTKPLIRGNVNPVNSLDSCNLKDAGIKTQ